jgi:hypothetical protein
MRAASTLPYDATKAMPTVDGIAVKCLSHSGRLQDPGLTNARNVAEAIRVGSGREVESRRVRKA